MKSLKLPALRAVVAVTALKERRDFLLLRFRRLPTALKIGQNPPQLPWEGYTVGEPGEAPQIGPQGATRRYIRISGTVRVCSVRKSA